MRLRGSDSPISFFKQEKENAMSISDTPIPPGGENGSATTDGDNLASIHKEIATHQQGNACCNTTTSYIHVYHHNSDCNSNHATNQNAQSATNGKDHSPENKDGQSHGESPVALVKQLFENIRPLFGQKAEPEKKEKSKKKIRSADPSSPTDSEHAAEEGENDKTFAPNDDENSMGWEEDLVPPPPPVKRLWTGIDGIAVMAFGVATPLLLAAMAMASCPKRITLVILNHPVETLIELLLLCAIPLANYRLWSSICKNDLRFSLLRGLLVGAAIATSMIIAGLAFAAIPAGYQELQSSIGTDFSTGFFFIGVQGLATAAIGLYLMNRSRLNREFASSKSRIIAYTVIGFVLGAAAFAGAEVRSWYVRIAQQQALSPIESERMKGLATLRTLDTERELRMETSDSRAAGIAGLFIPVKHSEMSKLYFTVCGKPLGDESSADFSSMSDDYLQRHVVGSPVKGLALARSAFNGLVSPNALTSTINWTFVFRNDTESAQEARAELAVPPGAVINGLTVWKNGDPLEAAFAAAGKAEGDAQINWVNVGHDNPAIITDLGRGRYLFHCYPIPQDEQLKVNLSVVVPLKLESLESTSLTFPRFIASNFALDGEHVLSLESTDDLSSRQKNIKKSKGLQGRTVLSGTLERSQLEHTPLIVNAKRAPVMTQVATLDAVATAMELKKFKQEEERKRLEEEAKKKADEHQFVLMIDGSRGVQQQLEDVKTVLNRERRSKKPVKKLPPGPKFAVRTITEVIAKAPKRLLVVLDGSGSIKERMPEVKKALQAVPASVPVWLRVASSETNVLSKPTPLKQALAELDKIEFAGGQDNLRAVVNAAEMAGETEGGAVLWIHGPQPGLNKDIFIMSPFRAHPSFFELALDTGCTDTIEYFKNHAEVGPFSPIQRTENLTEDLNDFFSKWQAGRREFVVNYALVDKPAKDCIVLKDRDKNELLQLNARSSVERLIREKKSSQAARIAVAYQFVSPVSCVAVIDSSAQATPTEEVSDGFGEATTDNSAVAPTLQGATNGTIGSDATVIMGVNTAGTVRVNNLANLEALLNIICNLIQMGAMMFGAVIILHGLVIRSSVSNFLGMRARFSPGMRLAFGAAIIVAGCMIPGLVNWFVASARDANLFS
jgi:hypothetical protein